MFVWVCYGLNLWTQQVFCQWFDSSLLFSPPGSMRNRRRNYGIRPTWVVWWMDWEMSVPCAAPNTTHGSTTTKQRPQLCCGSSRSVHLLMTKTPFITWIKKWVLAAVWTCTVSLPFKWWNIQVIKLFLEHLSLFLLAKSLKVINGVYWYFPGNVYTTWGTLTFIFQQSRPGGFNHKAT